MESALHGIFTLAGEVSEISLVRCAHSFDFRYYTNSCENPVHARFPWSNLYFLSTSWFTSVISSWKITFLPEKEMNFVNFSGDHFWKDPVTYRARKAILEIMIRLPWKAALLICSGRKERQNNCQVPKLERCSYCRIQRDLCHPKRFGTFKKRTSAHLLFL